MDNEYADRLRKGDWIVRPVSIATGRRIVEMYHYAKSATNTAAYVHGLFRKDADFFNSDCLGVAWWIPPTKSSAIATYPQGDWQKVLALTRLVMCPGVPKNACSFLLSRSIKMMEPGRWECLVTYADTWQNHTGGIYRASNWEYLGTTVESPVFVNESGKMMGRKRGPTTMTKSEITGMGFTDMGSFVKHKFRKIIIRKNSTNKKNE